MPQTPTPQESPSFSEASEALEAIVERFRNETLPLEEALNLFEQGVGHIKICQAKLTQAKGQVELLVKTLQADGESITQPFEA